jgi:hypothetical protein
MRRTIIVFYCIVALAACKDYLEENQQTNINVPSKLVVQNIRTDTTNTWSSIHNIRQLSKQLKLEPSETGFDSIQIRIWFDYSLAKKSI